MKEFDFVELIKEKETYTKQGVLLGMTGTIVHPRCIDGAWLVDFDKGKPTDKDFNVITIPVKEEHLKVVKPTK